MAILLIQTSFSQKNLEDNYSRFSYPLIGKTTTSNGWTVPVGGSCFFTVKKDSVYLTTALHVVSGCQAGGVRDENFGDTMILFNIYPKLQIDVSEFKKIDCKEIDKKIADIVHIPMEFSPTRVNVIENALILEEDIVNLDSFFIYGFPSKGHYIFDVFTYATQQPFDPLVIGQKLENGDFGVFTIGENSSPYNFGLSYNSSTTGLDGMSGSPIFARNKQTGKIFWGGLFTASTVGDEKQNWIVSPWPRYLK